MKKKLFRRLMKKQENYYLAGLITSKLISIIPLIIGIGAAKIIAGSDTNLFDKFALVAGVLTGIVYFILNTKVLVGMALEIEELYWNVFMPKRAKRFYNFVNYRLSSY